MKKHILLSLSTVLTFATLSCSSGFHENNATPTTPNTQTGGQTPGPGGAPNPSPDWNNFDFNAKIAGGLNSNFKAVTIDKVNKTITLLLPLPLDASLSGLLGSIQVPQVAGAVIALTQLPDLTPVLSITVPLANLVKPISGLPTQSLPNGDKLPDMPADAAPSTQVLLKGKLPVYLYISHMAISVFVNTPFDPTISTHVFLNDNSGNQVGGVYAIPYKANQKDGGFYIAVNVPSIYTDLILGNL